MKTLLGATAHFIAFACFIYSARGETVSPNVVIIFTDDQGWGDVGCYGSKKIRTPYLDSMAAAGIRFTDFHVAAAVCSASRAALLTGRYPIRTGVTGVIGAGSKKALPLSETTLAERFKAAGYATGIFGKWHLGNSPEVWPLRQGFDEWFGTVGSNDMGRNRPSLEQRRLGKAGVELVDMEKVIEVNPDQRQLTRRYTEKAIDFIGRHKGKSPFFVYVPHNMPHTPLFVSGAFGGKSEAGLYADTIEEIDWSVGKILGALKQFGLERDTIILFSSDNGPWLIFGDHGGSAGPFSGGKKQTLEGGMRVPLIARWPGKIPAGTVCHELVTALDLTPTLMALTGVESDLSGVDGVDVSPWWLGKGDDSKVERKPFFHFWERELRAVRDREWKFRLAHIDTQCPNPEKIGNGGKRGAVMKVSREQALFNLVSDPSESHDLSKSHPEILQRMKQMTEQGREIIRQSQ